MKPTIKLIPRSELKKVTELPDQQDRLWIEHTIQTINHQMQRNYMTGYIDVSLVGAKLENVKWMLFNLKQAGYESEVVGMVGPVLRIKFAEKTRTVRVEALGNYFSVEFLENNELVEKWGYKHPKKEKTIKDIGKRTVDWIVDRKLSQVVDPTYNWIIK